MNEWGVELESFAQAKALQTADIARLREGEKRDKRLAVFSQRVGRKVVAT
jgi:hypothetical protein